MKRGTKHLFPGAGPSVRAFASFAMMLDVVDSVSVAWDGVRVAITNVRDPEAVWRDLDAVWNASQQLYNRQVVSPMSAAPQRPDETHDHGGDTGESHTACCGSCLEKRLASASASAATACESGTCDCDSCLEKRLQAQYGLLN